MKKNSSQKALEVVSFVMIILACFTFVVAALIVIIGSSMDLNEQGSAATYNLSPGIVIVILAFFPFIGGVIDLVIGIIGLRCVRNPRKNIGSFLVVSLVGVLWSVGATFMSLLGNNLLTGTLPSAVISLLLPIICCALACRIKRECT